MAFFRILLVFMFAAILAYSGVAVSNHGVILVPQFFGAIAGMTWQGQFNTDFMMYLMLSGLWAAWRSGFTAGAVALANLCDPVPPLKAAT